MTDRQIDRRTDKAGCRVACTQLKSLEIVIHSIAQIKLLNNCLFSFRQVGELTIKDCEENQLLTVAPGLCHFVQSGIVVDF